MNVTIKQLLEIVVLTGASDLYVTTGASPTIRFRGEIVKLNVEPLTAYSVEQMILALLPDDQKLKFAQEKALDVALNSPGIGKFRLNLLLQKNRLSMVVHALEGGGATARVPDIFVESPSLIFADDEELTHAMTPPPARAPAESDPWQTGLMKKRQDLPKKRAA